MGNNASIMHNQHYSDSHQREIWRVVPELIRARELLLDLIWKDLRVRYRYAFMGFFWALLEPLLMTLILTFVFSKVFTAGVERYGVTTGTGYAAFILVGLIPWQFLAQSLTMGTRALVDNGNLIQKVYFPREVVPLAVIGNGLVNFLIGYGLTLTLFTVLVQAPGVGAVYLLAVFVIQIALMVGLTLILSCANVFFRDVSYMVDAAILFGFYATPVFYPPEMVAAEMPQLYGLYMLNPMAALLTSYRDLLWFNTLTQPSLLLSPILCATAMLTLGTWLFRRNAPVFADNF